MTLNKILYLLVEMGHHALAWRNTSLLAVGELWLKGKMDEMECGWLERKMVLRHPLEQHNSMQGRNVLRVTPTPLFIAFLGF